MKNTAIDLHLLVSCYQELTLNRKTYCQDSFKEIKILTLLFLSILESISIIRRYFPAISERPPRNEDYILYLPKTCSELIKNSILYNQKKMHNHQPPEIKSITFLSAFHKALKS